MSGHMRLKIDIFSNMRIKIDSSTRPIILAISTFTTGLTAAATAASLATMFEAGIGLVWS